MAIKIYEYKKCSTCRSALKYLESKGVRYEAIPIVDQPPSVDELTQMLTYLKKAGKGLKNLFNTSGEQYRELNIAEKLKDGMSEAAALKLLSKNGKLVKRPFLLTSKDGVTGFKEEEWDELALR